MFEPGSGSQVHDYNLGIPPSGLFWTTSFASSDIRVSRQGRRLVYESRDLPAIDSFQFLGPSDQTATVDFRVEWEATEPPVTRGMGANVPPDDPGAFLGELARAFATGRFSGSQLGFSFESLPGATSELGFAELGNERNGVFL